MKFFSSALLVASAALSVTAMFTPLVARNPHQHHAIAARVAAASPTQPPPIVSVTPRKRAAKRCKAPPSSSSSSSSSSASSQPSAPPAVPVNAGGAPPPSQPTPSPAAPAAAPPPPPPPPPATTTHAAPPPPPPSPTTTQAPAAPTPSSSGGDSGSHSGQGTWFDTGLGSCGITNSDSDLIVAVSHDLYDTFPGYNGANPNTNPVCGKMIKANYQDNSVIVKVVDRCEACKFNDLDFTPTAFAKLAPTGVGRIDITWDFM